MVVAGLLSGVQSDAPILDYEIEALQAHGDYKVKGHFNRSQVSAGGHWVKFGFGN